MKQPQAAIKIINFGHFQQMPEADFTLKMTFSLFVEVKTKMLRLFVFWLLLPSHCRTHGKPTAFIAKVHSDLDLMNEYQRIQNTIRFIDLILEKLPKEINCINILDSDDGQYHDRFEIMHQVLHRSQQFTIRHSDLDANSDRDYIIGELNLLLIDDYEDLE